MPAGGKCLGYKSERTCGQEGLGVQRLAHLLVGRTWGAEAGAPAGRNGLGYRSEHTCGWEGLAVQSGCTCKREELGVQK